MNTTITATATDNITIAATATTTDNFKKYNNKKNTSIREVTLNNLKKSAYELIKKSEQSFFELGETLNTLKGLMKHNEFSKWLDEEVNYSHNLANKYMKIAANIDKEAAVLLGVRKSYTLASLNEEMRNKILDNNDVSNMTCKALEELVKYLKDDNDTKVKTNDSKAKYFIKNIDKFKEDISLKIKMFTEYKYRADEETKCLIEKNKEIFDKLEELNRLILDSSSNTSDYPDDDLDFIEY